MKLSVSVFINQPIENVWDTITDFENCLNYIESIKKVEILNNPDNTLLGFKWKETREMFGKEATETMWITDYETNHFYQTRAESHGSIYVSRLSIQSTQDGSELTMSFSASPQTFFVKIVSACLGFMMKGAMKKAISKDLSDIKKYVEDKK